MSHSRCVPSNAVDADRGTIQDAPGSLTDELPPSEMPECPATKDSCEQEQHCSICMADYTKRVTLKECGHFFCQDCIEQWARSGKETLCPLCKVPLSMIVLQDGTEAVLEKGTDVPKYSDAAPDLGCLDHSYFLGEIRRLRSRANAVQERVQSHAFGCQRGGHRAADQSYMALMEVVCSLDDYHQMLQAQHQFDPETVLASLYSMEETVRAVSAGTWELEPSAWGARGGGGEPVRYSAEDAADMHELYEDDVLWNESYDYEDAQEVEYEMWGRGSGHNRQPASKKKGGRSGSSNNCAAGTSPSTATMGKSPGSTGRSPSNSSLGKSPRVVCGAPSPTRGTWASGTPPGTLAVSGYSPSGVASSSGGKSKSKNDKRREKKRAAAQANAQLSNISGLCQDLATVMTV